MVIKIIAGKRIRFNADGSVTNLSGPSPAPDAVKPSPVEQVKQKAQEMVQAVEEVVKPKRRGRPKKKVDAE
jgi:hypothetical protein